MLFDKATYVSDKANTVNTSSSVRVNENFYSFDFILFLFGLPAVFKVGLSLSQCRAARAVPVAVQPRARFTSRIGLV